MLDFLVGLFDVCRSELALASCAAAVDEELKAADFVQLLENDAVSQVDFGFGTSLPSDAGMTLQLLQCCIRVSTFLQNEVEKVYALCVCEDVLLCTGYTRYNNKSYCNA